MNRNNLIGSRTYSGSGAPHTSAQILNTAQTIFFDLPHLGAICVTGDASQTFLQGQVTCDMRAVTPQTMRQGALCNIKGRILALIDIIQYHDAYWLILPKDLITSTLHTLEKTALLSRVKLHAAPEARIAAVWTKQDSSHAPYTVEAMPDWCHYTTRSEHSILFSVEPMISLATVSQSSYPNSTILDEIDWHYLQLMQGYVSLYPETRGLFLPHTLQLPTLGFIDFQKGCYKGQEIIARMHYRATNLKHNLQISQFTLASPPVLGTTLPDPEKPQETLGEVIDYCPVHGNHSQPTYLIAYC